MNGRWFNGPDFLQLEEQLWPVEDGRVDLNEGGSHLRCNVETTAKSDRLCHSLLPQHLLQIQLW